MTEVAHFLLSSSSATHSARAPNSLKLLLERAPPQSARVGADEVVQLQDRNESSPELEIIAMLSKQWN